ncbi:MAG TPA: alkaline phosphatase family protein, partial [Vicinamibacterales bacterium]|nr:alkaline phosphatase family protein [Vicinamibacterales bacterium]
NRTMGGGQWDAAMKAAAGTPAGWDIDQLGTDLANGDVGNLNFLEPDQCDDMHGVKVQGTTATDSTLQLASDCGKDDAILFRGDNYTDYLIRKIEASSVWKNTNKRTAIVIMFDEGSATTGFTACCGWNPSSGRSIAGRSLGSLVKNTDGSITVESIAQYNQGNKGHGTSIFCVLTNQPLAPKGVVDSDAYSHISFVRTIQDMFGLADPGDDWSYMNRSKFTETFIARNLKYLPEYLESADPHFDAVRAMNHAHRIPADYVQKSGFLSPPGPQRGPDANQLNVWALTRARNADQ